MQFSWSRIRSLQPYFLILYGSGTLILVWFMAVSASDRAASSSFNLTNSYIKRAGSSITLIGDGKFILAVNPDSDSISMIETQSRSLVREIPVGDDPCIIVTTKNGRRAFVSNRGGHSISVVDLVNQTMSATIAVGARPYGLVLSDDETHLYVAEQGADQIRVIETEGLETVDTIKVADRPSGLTLSANNRSLLVTHLFQNVITSITIAPNQVFSPLILNNADDSSPASNTAQSTYSKQITYPSKQITLWADSNLVQAIIVGPDGNIYIPHTRSNSRNTSLTVDTTVFPLVSIVDGASQQHLAGQQFNLDILDPPAVGLPFDLTFTPAGHEMWIVNAASNDVTVIDLNTRQQVAHIEVGHNPRGIAIDPAGTTAFVNNTLAGTISVIDTETYSITSVITTTTIPLSPVMLEGKRLFFSSDDTRMSLDQWMSCNTCHFDGEHDGRTWLRKNTGPRNTPSLLGMAETFPLRWSGEWDEAADSEFAIRVDSFGSGLINGVVNCSFSPPDCAQHPPNAGLSSDLDALAAYLNSLQVADHPNHIGGVNFSAAAERGQSLFNNPDVGCATCHTPPLYTDNGLHDVGTATADERLGNAFNTPSLRGLYDSAPYFHDGRASTLLETITLPTSGGEHDVRTILSESEIQDLLAFLAELP